MEQTIKVGDYFEYNFSFKQQDVIEFAHASGDFNPIHLDSEYAKTSIFGRTILHGFLGGSVFSKVFGTIFPGSGTIYLKQDLTFLRPMFTGTAYKATFLVLSTEECRNRALVKTEIIDEENSVIITGEALIKHSSIR